MTPDQLADHLREELGERVLATDVAYDTLTVTVGAEHYAQAARYCKQTLGMSFFDFLSGVDEREEGFSVVTRLYNHISRQAVLLKAMVPGGRDEPRMPTLTEVYRGANWHEREAYDMFGIVFEGHPGLLPRILTVENFEGWPLRKEFLLTSREVKPWPGAKEPGGDDDEAKPAAAAPAPGQDPAERAAAAKEKAERAKKKAAEARARKAAEKAAAQETDAPAAESDAPAAETDAPAAEDEVKAPEEAAAAESAVDPAGGAAPEPGGTPGVEAEGIHDKEESSSRPSVEGDPAGGSGSDAETAAESDAGDDDE